MDKMESLELADHADIGAAEGLCDVWDEGSKSSLALVRSHGKENEFDLFFDNFSLSFAASLLVVDVAGGVVGLAAAELHAASAEASLASRAREVVAGVGGGVGVDSACGALVDEGGDGSGGGAFAWFGGEGTTECDGDSEEKGLGEGLERDVTDTAGTFGSAVKGGWFEGDGGDDEWFGAGRAVAVTANAGEDGGVELHADAAWLGARRA